MAAAVSWPCHARRGAHDQLKRRGCCIDPATSRRATPASSRWRGGRGFRRCDRRAGQSRSRSALRTQPQTPTRAVSPSHCRAVPVIEIVRSSAQNAKVYQPGEPMFNFGSGRAAPIAVPAVELFVGSWPAGTRHVLRLKLIASTPYSLQARASFRRANGSFVHLPQTGQVDQQGAPSRLIDIAPRQAERTHEHSGPADSYAGPADQYAGPAHEYARSSHEHDRACPEARAEARAKSRSSATPSGQAGPVARTAAARSTARRRTSRHSDSPLDADCRPHARSGGGQWTVDAAAAGRLWDHGGGAGDGAGRAIAGAASPFREYPTGSVLVRRARAEPGIRPVRRFYWTDSERARGERGAVQRVRWSAARRPAAVGATAATGHTTVVAGHSATAGAIRNRALATTAAATTTAYVAAPAVGNATAANSTPTKPTAAGFTALGHARAANQTHAAGWPPANAACWR